MDYFKVLAVSLALLFTLSGCSTKVTTSKIMAPESAKTPATITAPPPQMIMPKKTQARAVDPAKGLTFTFSAVDARARTVLYAMAVDMGLNLVFAQDVDANISVSANFVRTPMADAIELIMDIANLQYEIRGNVFYVYKYRSTNFNLPHISVVGAQTASLGGDVVGGADRDGTTNLTGEFTVNYERSQESGDFYKQLENNLTSILANDPNSSFTINRMAGIVTVHTTRSNMNRIKTLLENIVTNSVRQVQIEAKIIEVVLEDSWSYGINWSSIFSGGSVNIVQNLGTVAGSAGQMSVVQGTFNAVVSAVAKYGKVDTLANPRVTVMNGQSAMITAGTITPFWERSIESSNDGNTTYRDYTYERYNVLDGVMIGVTAFIHDDGTVILNVMPVTTSIQGTKEITDESGTIQADAPLLDIKESGTIVQVEDGAMLVMGGLITNNKTVVTTSIPILGSIPFLGYLFSSEKMEYTKRELVIFIKPTIVYGNSKVVIK